MLACARELCPTGETKYTGINDRPDPSINVQTYSNKSYTTP